MNFVEHLVLDRLQTVLCDSLLVQNPDVVVEFNELIEVHFFNLLPDRFDPLVVEYELVQTLVWVLDLFHFSNERLNSGELPCDAPRNHLLSGGFPSQRLLSYVVFQATFQSFSFFILDASVNFDDILVIIL